MNKYTILPLLLLLSTSFFQVKAQPGTDKIPDTDNNNTIFELLPVPGEGFVSVYTDNQEAPTKVVLTYTGVSETIESKKEISLVRRGLSAMVESAFIWDGELTLITSLFYPGPQRDLLFVRRYSLPDFKEIASEKITEAYVPGRLRIPFGYAISPDSTNIMFYSWSYAVPKDPVKMEIHVLNRQLERQWTKRFLLPNKNANFYIYACKVDNDGNAYLLCEDYKGKVGAKIQDQKIERFVLRLDQSSSEATSFVIELPDKVITDLKFTMDKQGNLYGGGFYREAKKIYQAGIFAYRIDQKTQGFQKKEIPINKEDYQNLHAYSDGTGKYLSGTRQFRNYVLNQITWDDQEGLTLIGEQRIFENENDKYNDIMVAQLGADLRKKWIVRVPKAQATPWGQPYLASYCFLQRDNKKFLLFNDHLKNLPEEGRTPSRLKLMDFIAPAPQTYIHMVQLDSNGKLHHHNLTTLLKGGSQIALAPELSRSDGNNTFLLYLVLVSQPGGEGEVSPIRWVEKKE